MSARSDHYSVFDDAAREFNPCSVVAMLAAAYARRAERTNEKEIAWLAETLYAISSGRLIYTTGPEPGAKAHASAP